MGCLRSHPASGSGWGFSLPLSADARGVVIIEYVVVLLLVSMLACGAIVLLGMAISKFYASQEAWISIPLP